MVTLAFGVLIVALVIFGSNLIMADLNEDMVPPAELMNLQMQTDKRRSNGSQQGHRE